MTYLLETRDVSKSYGAFLALDRVSMTLSDDEVLAVVGPNGAGKTTLVNLLTGLAAPTTGEVLLRGETIAGATPVELADRGVARSFQLVQIFPRLTVAETIAASVVTRQGERWRVVAAIFGLQGRLGESAQLLSQGEKKLLDVASAFALDPQVMLLDEPTSGISTADKHRIMRTLIDAARRGGVKSLILVEHDMDLVAAYSDRIIALSEGKVLADLPPEPFFADPVIIETVVGKRRGH